MLRKLSVDVLSWQKMFYNWACQEGLEKYGSKETCRSWIGQVLGGVQ